MTKRISPDGFAIVTGAGRGIGRAVALAFAAAGTPVVAADVDPDAATGTAQRAGPPARALGVDVTDEDAVRAAFAEIETFGGCATLVNAAGIASVAPMVDHTLAAWDRVLAVNLTGSFLCLREAVRGMLARGRRGAVVNISSIVSVIASPLPEVAYDASKGGVSALTRSAAHELAPHGIRVNAVAPGPIATGLYPAPAGPASGAAEGGPSDTSPLGRTGTVRDVAGPVLFLCSPAARWITGQVLAVDGGRLLR